MHVEGDEGKYNHRYLASTVHSFQTSEEKHCEKTKKLCKRMQNQIHYNSIYDIVSLR
jgi:hypothetical protein